MSENESDRSGAVHEPRLNRLSNTTPANSLKVQQFYKLLILQLLHCFK